MKVTTNKNVITIQPEEGDLAPRIVILASGKGETDQHLMGWLELNMQAEQWKETLVFSAWNDDKISGPHYEIASGCNKGAGGVTRPISFWMNEENPTRHREVLRLNPDGSFVFMGGWVLKPSSTGNGMQLLRPNGSVADEWM